MLYTEPLVIDDLVDPTTLRGSSSSSRRHDQSQHRGTSAGVRSRSSSSKPSSVPQPMIQPRTKEQVHEEEEEEEEDDEEQDGRYNPANDTTTPSFKDAPHCVTCACLSSKMTCSYQQQQQQQHQHEVTCDFDRSERYACPGNLLHPPMSCRNSRTERRRPATRRKRARTSVTVDELVREMNMSSMLASAEDEPAAVVMGKLKEGLRSPRKHRCEAGDYYAHQTTLTTATSSRHRRPTSSKLPLRYSFPAADDDDEELDSIKTWQRSSTKKNVNLPVGKLIAEVNSLQQPDRGRPPAYDCGDRQLVEPTIDDLGSDNSAIDATTTTPDYGPVATAVTTRDKWQHRRRSDKQRPKSPSDPLIRHHQLDADKLALTPVPKEGSHVSEFECEEDGHQLMSGKEDDEEAASEAHVQQLKLVRMEFIERIYEEVGRLHRLQRHLDGCSPRRSSQLTRSVSTMTSARPSSVQLDLTKNS